MKLEWLETIRVVARELSFSEAAAQLHCAQSTVSRHVQNVEEELGVALFIRSSNSNVVKKSAAGEALLPIVGSLLSEYDRLTVTARYERERLAPIRLTLPSMMFSSGGKANFQSLFYLEYPNVQIDLSDYTGPPQASIGDGSVDAALLSETFWKDEPDACPAFPEEVECVPLGTQPLLIAVAETSPLARRESVRFSDLRDERFIFNSDILEAYRQPHSSKRSNMFVKACMDAGFSPHIMRVDRHLPDVKLVLTSQNKGAFPCTIPDFLQIYPGVKYLPICDAPFVAKYYLLYRRDNDNPALYALKRFLRSRFQHT